MPLAFACVTIVSLDLGQWVRGAFIWSQPRSPGPFRITPFWECHQMTLGLLTFGVVLNGSDSWQTGACNIGV